MSSLLLLTASINMACIEQQLLHGDQSQTLAELKQRCQSLTEQPLERQPVAVSAAQEIDRRRAAEKQIDNNRFGLSAYHNNYVLLASYNNNPNQATWEYGPEGIQPWEVKAQFSFKVPITPDWFGDDSGLYIAYTNQSWWQAYNGKVSAPFRDTNHMPELVWIHKLNDYQFGDWQWDLLSLSLNHQSNGRSGEASRSWNRLIATSAFSYNRWVLGGRAWYRLPEDAKIDDGDPNTPPPAEGDDNPDITDFMGYGELFAIYNRDDHNFSLRTRGNLREHQGGLELGWSFPLTGKLRGHVQGYWGYGENLLDYNHRSERISFGVELTPLL
ncbi:phospholipase A [Ferrimonas senticii]|uniref:phospholipase A n=1 Tax=Ferrimonas senticii TaxID=394566 RepID=UPI0003F82C01|nr:phospholipase A [Ferrimonas senticii]